MTELEKKYLPAERYTAWGSFIILLATYWLTVAPTVSYWDCPEYVSAAYLLEIGHPPGNPTWMLVERIATMLAPAPEYVALAVNLSSGLLTAFAAFFLAKTIFRVGLWVLLKQRRRRIPAPLAAAGAALCGTLAFGWCDSVWYSAVEAEVYAMSIFMTSLCVWLMAKWAGTRSRGDSWRLLVLLAYLFGLSIGIHQLNLLCIPALAMIWATRRGIRNPSTLAAIFILSLAMVGFVLMGVMPSSIALAARIELIAVNYLNLPALSGVAIYVALLAVSLIVAIIASSYSTSRRVMALATFPAIFFSGIFTFSEHFLLGALLSAVAALLLVKGSNFKARRLSLCIWMLAMLLTGYASYALIPVRGFIPSPANSAMPGEPFSFASYQSREQYGSKPLFYGETPYSRPLLLETRDSITGKPLYKRYITENQHPYFTPKEEGARIADPYGHISEEEMTRNRELIAREGDAYIMRGEKSRLVKTPELNMFMPRITSTDPSDLQSYRDWVGMDTSNMTRFEVSFTLDSLGRPAGRLNEDGSRTREVAYRPTYLQNAQWLATYQTYYMYGRYLLWNFAGRQNDIPSTGEVQHGNFITGFPAIDDAMLGADSKLPPEAGSDNPGRNRYFLLPLLLGVAGMVLLLRAGRRGKQACAINAILFIMTGFAIILYLNQGPGEPRERDYSFLGSYLAYSVWIGFGSLAIARLCRSAVGFLIPLAVVAWTGIENYDDHDRSHRYAADSLTRNILNSLDKDAVIFVNGDNYTFPLWYAQEVEGVRRDVRVVNLAYLNSSAYAANLLRDWRDSKRLPATLTRGDIIWDAFRHAAIAENARDTLDATEALRLLRESPDTKLPARYARLRVSPDSTIIYDLRNIARGGYRSAIDFGKLMMFDIIATNAEQPEPRPIYWLSMLGKDRRIGLTPWTSQGLFAYRFGVMPDSAADAALTRAASRLLPPNRHHTDAYMDHVPASQITFQRGSMTAAARRLLRHGLIADAVEILRKADTMMGDHYDSFGVISYNDDTFNTRRELGKTMTEAADSIDALLARGEAERLISVTKKPKATSLELRARGNFHLRAYKKRHEQWLEYYNSLPPRLQKNTAPIP